MVRAPWTAVAPLSLAFWVVSAWWWPFATAGRSRVLAATLAGSFLLALLRLLPKHEVGPPPGFAPRPSPPAVERRGLPPPLLRTGPSLVVLAAALGLLAPAWFWHNAPGPRIAFQTTTARLIVWRDGIPATAEPLLPLAPVGAHAPAVATLVADLSLVERARPRARGAVGGGRGRGIAARRALLAARDVGEPPRRGRRGARRPRGVALAGLPRPLGRRRGARRARVAAAGGRALVGHALALVGGRRRAAARRGSAGPARARGSDALGVLRFHSPGRRLCAAAPREPAPRDCRPGARLRGPGPDAARARSLVRRGAERRAIRARARAALVRVRCALRFARSACAWRAGLAARLVGWPSRAGRPWRSPRRCCWAFACTAGSRAGELRADVRAALARAAERVPPLSAICAGDGVRDFVPALDRPPRGRARRLGARRVFTEEWARRGRVARATRRWKPGCSRR